MKRATHEPGTPTPTPFDAVAHLLRVRETFTCQGHVFRKGDVLDAKDELVAAICTEHPLMFQPAELWR